MVALPAGAQHQVERLKQIYSASGDSIFVALYCLPESKDIVIQHLRDDPSLEGFEIGFWGARPEEENLILLEEIAVAIDREKGAMRNDFSQRIIDWIRISSQLDLMKEFIDGHERFLDQAYADPLLQPAFKWILDQRNPDFDPKFIGGTFSSAQMKPFHAELVKTLLDTPHRERMECFSRLFASIATSTSER